MPTRVHWSEDVSEVHRLAYWMHQVGLITDPVDLLDLVERPWHYETEYAQMLADQEAGS